MMSEGDLLSLEAIVCTLTDAELAARRTDLLPGLLHKADSQETIPEGFRWGFRETNGLLNELASVIDAERQCCKFLRFRLTFEPGGGPLWLEVSGPEGTQEFLLSILSKAQPPTPIIG